MVEEGETDCGSGTEIDADFLGHLEEMSAEDETVATFGTAPKQKSYLGDFEVAGIA